MRRADGERSRRRERWLVAFLAVGMLGVLTAWTTHASLSATAINEGNLLTAGDVVLGTNAAHTPLYDRSDRAPGDTVVRCLRVTYTGSLDADVRLYASPVGPAGQYLHLTVTAGSGPTVFPSCAGFVPRPGAPAFSGTLAGFATAHRSWSSGLALTGPTGTGWTTDDAVVYRFELTQSADNAGQARSTGPHVYTWEARNR